MIWNSETFRSTLRDLIHHLESNNTDRAEPHIRDAVEYLANLQKRPSEAAVFGMTTIEDTWMALVQAEEALRLNNLDLALRYSEHALARWERVPRSSGTQI